MDSLKTKMVTSQTEVCTLLSQFKLSKRYLNIFHTEKIVLLISYMVRMSF